MRNGEQIAHDSDRGWIAAGAVTREHHVTTELARCDNHVLRAV